MTKSWCHHTTLSSEMMDVIESDLSNRFDGSMQTSKLHGDNTDLARRNSQNSWVPTTYWLGGLIWHYFKEVNDDFFHYDLDQIDGESMQYTRYALNEHYHWHQDEGVAGLYKPLSSGNRNDESVVTDFINNSAQRIRKLSAVLQLSDGEDYEGGATQVRDVDNTTYTIPRERGTLVFFDSRCFHRAKTVRKGLRKSLIIWAVGPRWK